MSAQVATFHVAVDDGESTCEVAACSVESNPHGVPRTAEDGRDTPSVELLPCDQEQQFTLVVAEPRKRCSDPRRSDTGFAWAGRWFTFDRVLQRAATALAAAVVGDHPARGGVQPEQAAIALRHVVETPPGDRERLGHDVESVV
jgi:hypothetical protein